jgi:hypothetical protein
MHSSLLLLGQDLARVESLLPTEDFFRADARHVF